MKTEIIAVQEFKIQLNLSEGEARALDAMVGYGFKAFIEVFYQHLGKAYMQPYEIYLKQFFEDVRAQIPTALHKVDEAKKAFKK